MRTFCWQQRLPGRRQTCKPASRVSRLALFQRTAQWVFPRDNPAYAEADRRRFRDEPDLADFERVG